MKYCLKVTAPNLPAAFFNVNHTTKETYGITYGLNFNNFSCFNKNHCILNSYNEPTWKTAFIYPLYYIALCFCSYFVTVYLSSIIA